MPKPDPLTGQKENAIKSGARYEPRQSQTEHNNAFRRTAHERLDQQIDIMEHREEYGTVGVSVTFERGEIRQVRRTLDGTDRPAR
ncbi:MAG TPA: hypothetical protein VLL76_02360 [Candidatus Omnitrophota bacterium]|nr:hypothetical protein [Candidatus Omnitrophota bacterium]